MQITYIQEIFRKLIHLSSLWMPASLYLLGKDISIKLFIVAFILVSCFEIIRRTKNKLPSFFYKILREKEKIGKLTGAFYMILAALIVTIIFPIETAISSLVILMISDSCAAIIGRRFGKIKILEKSLEGSFAFLVSSILIVCFVNWLYATSSVLFLWSGVVSAFVVTIIELVATKLKIDDNFAIPVGFCVVQKIIMLLLVQG